MNAPAYADGRIHYDDQELIIGNYFLTACADLRTGPGRHVRLSPAGTTAVSPSRWQDSGKRALPGQAR